MVNIMTMDLMEHIHTMKKRAISLTSPKLGSNLPSQIQREMHFQGLCFFHLVSTH